MSLGVREWLKRPGRIPGNGRNPVRRFESYPLSGRGNPALRVLND